MKAVSHAVATLQSAPVGVPVGRYQPQVKVIAEFVESVVKLQRKNEELRAQLLEAHERFGKLLGGQSAITGTRPTCVIVDDVEAKGSMYFDAPPLPVPTMRKGQEPTPDLEMLMPEGYKFSIKTEHLSRNLPQSFAHWIAAGWTVNTMIDNGYLVKV